MLRKLFKKDDALARNAMGANASQKRDLGSDRPSAPKDVDAFCAYVANHSAPSSASTSGALKQPSPAPTAYVAAHAPALCTALVSAEAWPDLLRLQQALGSVPMTQTPKPLAALRAWTPDPLRITWFVRALNTPDLAPGNRQILRWMCALEGPAQSVYATQRRHRGDKHVPVRLVARSAQAGSMRQQLENMLPNTFSKQMLTVTLGKTWTQPTDLWMTLHGQQKNGHVGSLQRLDAELGGALCMAGRGDDASGDPGRLAALSRNLVAGCAEGVAGGVQEFLQQCDADIDGHPDIERVLAEASSKSPTAAHKDRIACEEYLRAFQAKAWRAYAADRGLATDYLTPKMAQRIFKDADYSRDYDNAAHFFAYLQKAGTYFANHDEAALAALVEQVI